MYSDKHPVFNCVQRGHQNALEMHPAYLVFQILAGLQYPVSCVRPNPEKRLRGEYGYLGLLSLVGMSLMFACKLLNWC
ncbi:glutathione S-transferase 3, mitochondrial-like [Saccoglossus kowalevskii]